MQNLTKNHPGGEERIRRLRVEAEVHLAFCVQLYKEQISAGRYFVHEHPKTAASWHVECMKTLAMHPMVMKIDADLCAFGLMSRDQYGVAPAKKPTTFLTNSISISAQLNRKCPGCRRHIPLVNGRASAAQVYPRKLCEAVCRGAVMQAQDDAG